ncbi:MAG: metallophosphoesterase [Kofleriaceae bacterium]
MWFLYVGVGLGLLIVSGLYTRRRIADTLAYFGVSPRKIRIVRWAVVWLLYAFPILMIVSVFVSVALGRATLPRYDGMLASWLLGVPFLWAVLITFQSLPWLLVIEVAHAIVRRQRGIATAARVRAIAVFAVVGGFALYTPIRILAERGDLRVRHHRVGDATTTTPFKIAFIADIQQDDHTDAARAAEVYELVNASQPDVVLSGGDWINSGPDHIEESAATASLLRSRLGTFSVRGDHEHFAYVDRERSVTEVERAMQRHGVAMLNNEVRWFDHHGKRVAVAFVNYNYIHRTDRLTIEALIAGIADADYSIAVTHQLDAGLAAMLENKVDLVLGAHTHGGQVNPVLGLVHVKLARLETELVDGRYQLGSTTVIVTSGVGYSLVPIRYAAPGSIELIELAL